MSASAGMLYLPAVALAIGIIAGSVCTLGFHYLTPLLERKIGLYDTCGIHNLHALPGTIGGIFSAIVVASYHSGYDSTYADLFSPVNVFLNPSVNGDFLRQGWLQIAGTFACMGIGLISGLITGAIMNLTYNEDPNSFFLDKPYF